MPTLPLLAPGTPVNVPLKGVRGGTVERAMIRSGTNPLAYTVSWRASPRGPVRRETFPGGLVEEPEPVPGEEPPAPVNVFAPGTPVNTPMRLPNAAVEWVDVRPGKDDEPEVVYVVAWSDNPGQPARRAGFREDQLTEAPGAAFVFGGSGRLAELGAAVADMLKTQE